MPPSRRTLHLREWEPKTLQLEGSEVAALTSLGADLRIEPAPGLNSYLVTPSSTVGAVTTPALELIISPKLPIERVFYVLGYSRKVPSLRDASRLDPRDGLVEGFVNVFLNAVATTIRRGLLMGYQRVEEALPTVKGRVRFADQLRRRFDLALPVEVVYDDYTPDIEENRLIKGALRRVSQLRLRSRALRGRVSEVLAAFDGVADRRYARAEVPTFRYTRLNERYRSALELARLVLQNSSLELHAGKTTMAGLLFDMNKIFEDFVFSGIGEHLERLRRRERWLQGASVRLDEGSRLRPLPDLTLWSGSRCVFVGDAKYKRTDEGQLSDLYQLLAYCTATGLPEGLLIYAEGSAQPVRHHVLHDGPVLRVETLDIAGEIEDLTRNCDRLARRIDKLAARALGAAEMFGEGGEHLVVDA